MNKESLYEGDFLRLCKEKHWEYVQRTNSQGVVVITAVTDENKILFVEQFRIPVNAKVIELPAGLVGDQGFSGEPFTEAAKRELHEETGYQAESMEELISGPVSSGLSSEILHFCLAKNIKKTGEGGGDESEDIIVHEIALKEVDVWIEQKQKEGYLVDPKVFVGIHFLHK